MNPLVLHSDFHCNLVRQAKTLHPLSTSVDDHLPKPSACKRSKKRAFVSPPLDDDYQSQLELLNKSTIYYSNIDEVENFHHWRNRFQSMRLIDSPHCLADQSQP
jgi:hypothetical protein